MPTDHPTSHRPGPRLAVIGGLVLATGAGLVAVVVGVAPLVAPPVPPPVPPPPPAAPKSSGDLTEQIHTFCGRACHAYPSPDIFPRRAWRAEVERGYRFFEQSGLPLQAPPVAGVIRHFEDGAPDELPPAVWTNSARPYPVRFEPREYPGPATPDRPAISNVTLVRLPPPGTVARPGTATGPLDVVACDMRNGLVMLLRPSDPAPAWKILGRVPNPAHAEVLDLDGDGIPDVLVACLGSFLPTDRHCGSVVWLRGRADGSFTPVTLLEDVGRVADVQAADFRGTGKRDLVVAEFGWLATGRVLFLENQTTDWEHPTFVPRTVDPRHGAIHVPVADLDGDGKPDVVAVFAQEHETVVAFLNQGDGRFRAKTLYRAPHPGWGSSGIQLVDLNGDGRLDVLYTNGDILDEPYLLKPYHGVQWLENKGNLRFEHHPLTPMYGVHRAVAADLRGTGARDVVAVSFLPAEKFPQRATRRPDALVILEHVGRGRYERHSLATVACDHVSCVVGDVYGTGRQDIVLGNFGSPTSDAPVTIWRNAGTPGR